MMREPTSSRRKTLGALLLVAALVVAACGGDNADDPGGAGASGTDATTTAEAADVDAAGVLKVAQQLDLPQGVHFDPIHSVVVSDQPWMQLAIGTLLRQNSAGGFDPFLAESYEVVDPRTVRMTIRQGVTYTDGGALDAEAVRRAVLRTAREPASEAVRAALHAGIKPLEDIKVDGPLQVTFTLSTPTAGELLAAMASREGTVVSPTQLAAAPDAIDSKPASAGPYVLTDFRPQQIMSLRKNPGFFDASHWQLGGIDFVHTPPGPPGVNGLLSGTVDVADAPEADMARIEADDTFKVAASFPDFGYVLLNLCSGKPPFDDVRVRQAVQMGIDRGAINDLVYGGRGEVAYGLWPQDHRDFNPKVRDIVTYDSDRAAKLLKDAGVGDITVDIYFPATSGDYPRVAQVLQQQLAKLGITLNIVSSRDLVSEFIEPQLPGIMLIRGARTGVEKYSRVFAPGAAQALCGQGHPEIVGTVAPAAAGKPDDPEAIKAFQAAELMIAENAYVIPIVYAPQFTVWNSERVGGEPAFNASGARNVLLFDTVYVRK